MEKNKKLIYLIAGARPNFMKIAPLYHQLKNEVWCETRIIHTGQHYDHNMSGLFFQDLNLPEPDIHLGVSSGTHGKQSGEIMKNFEKVCLEKQADLIVVVGDVNSTMACTIAAKKLCIRVAHLEAGLRSFDRTMPEEINRVITDTISDILWTPSPDADRNLRKEGIKKSKIVRVGNIMIDSYIMLEERIKKENELKNYKKLKKNKYGIITLHRPKNVDVKREAVKICDIIMEIGKTIPIIFPIHPRTKKMFIEFNIYKKLKKQSNIILCEPLSYIKFMSLISDSLFVITDSGGIQEETTYLNIPCLTLRDTTERPITLTHGTNYLVNVETIVKYSINILNGDRKNKKNIKYWDGKTAQRIIKNLRDIFNINN